MIKNDFSDQLILLESTAEKNIFKNEKVEYSKWIATVGNMKVIVIGDKNSPNDEYICMADEILKDFDKYKNLAAERMKSWLGEEDLFPCVSMVFGQIYYAGTRIWDNCFSLTFVKTGFVNQEWFYTVKFKSDGWPVGVEVWSESRCNEVEKNNCFVDFIEEIEFENNQLQEEALQFMKEHVKMDVKYYIDEVICSCYCGTKKTNGYFYAIRICQDTGEIIYDAYTKYTVKYVNRNSFLPIAIEFWIS